MNSGSYVPIASPELNGNEATYVQECIESTWISSAGRFISAFEEEFARFCGTKFAVATNNGTTAMHVALVALGIGPGDEVIVPTLTYIATANAVRYCGATPVLADSEPIGMSIDVEDVRGKITPRTKAIVPVHLYGQPADMEAVNALAREHGLFVLEDAAEAHGATVNDRPVGSLGDCAAFSFYGNKIITTGEGGAVTTNDAELAARLRLYRGQGMDTQRRYWFPVIGYNYRMTNIAAAIGLAQLEGVEEKLRLRALIADQYAEGLAEVKGVNTPEQVPWGKSVNWLYSVLLDVAAAEERDEIGRRMLGDGIETRPVFYPMHQMPPYFDRHASFPVADELARRGLSLPTHTGLAEADVRRIVESLRTHVSDLIGTAP
jgi:perosamine synthetase